MQKPKNKKQTRYVFICGGVVSGLGKGIVCSSIGMILKSCGYSVNHIKIDPYLNIDAGTMRPAEHGEVYVTDDGGEIDQDLGNYERFTNQSFSKENNITSGKVFLSVITKERELFYKGRDVEMIPDVPNEIIRRFHELEKKADGSSYDFIVVEIGGTTGDIENLPFLYAAREVGRERESLYVLVSLVPFLRNVGELKTKPTQHAVTQLRSTGINPDILVTREERPLDEPRRETLARRCFLESDAIFDDPDSSSIYEVPLILERQGMSAKIMRHFGLPHRKPDFKEWKKMEARVRNPKKEITIALVGKYVKHGGNAHRDVYVSVLEAIKHAGAANNVKVNVLAFDSNEFNASELEKITISGMVVPQGWGSRGVEGKIAAVGYARTHKIPFLGLCFGMQMAVIEYARTVAGLDDANSSEVDANCRYPVIHLMPNQEKYLAAHQFGGTIRLGSWPCQIIAGTQLENAYSIYGKDENMITKDLVIHERHRHRYEFNNEYRDKLVKSGLVISGLSPDGQLVEAIELPKNVHPFFVATQFHPEYKSRFLSAHPLFMAFVKACETYQ